MALKNNDPEQVNLGDDNHDENGIHKSQFNNNIGKDETPDEKKEEEVLKPKEEDTVADNDKKDDKFSPGEPDGYDADEFATE